MNLPLIAKTLGRVMQIVGISMIPSFFVAVYYKGYDIYAFTITIFSIIILGTALDFSFRPKTKNMYARDGIVVVAMAWVLISVFGCLPAYISGAIPSFTDSLFESVSGFTTTGATILTEIETLPKGVLFWRSFTQWLGGMGVLVFMVAIVPKLDARTLYMLKAESPGPSPEKLVPKLVRSAQILYIIYIVMTAILTILLIISGLPIYDSVTNALATAGTGGFSVRNLSIGEYNNPAAEIIITVFMLLFGVNFSVYFFILVKRFKEALLSEELRVYFFIVLTSIAAIALDILPVYRSVAEALRYSSFQVASIITTTGYATADYNLWPSFSKTIIIILTMLGGCSGSTSGGIKIIRIALIIKIIKRELNRLLHPRSINTVRFDKKNVSEEIVSGVQLFFISYIAVMIAAVLLLSLDNFDFETNFTAVLTSIGNVGPGLSLVGPSGNFAMFSKFSKLVLSFCMLLGRLEVFPILLMFFASPSFFRRKAHLMRK